MKTLLRLSKLILPLFPVMLQKKGYGISERTVSVYMKEMGLKACWIRKWHAAPKVKLDSTKLKNLLKQKFNPKRPNAVWCTDITYIWTNEGFMYLSTIIDLFSRKISVKPNGEKLDFLC